MREIPSSTIYQPQRNTITTHIFQLHTNLKHLISPTSLGIIDSNPQWRLILISPSIPSRCSRIISIRGRAFKISFTGCPSSRAHPSRCIAGLPPQSAQEESTSTIITRLETRASIEQTSLLQLDTDLIICYITARLVYAFWTFFFP